MVDKLLHKYLRLPYSLHVREFRKARNKSPIVLFLHGIGNTGETWKDVIDVLPEDVGVIVVDLLGFGGSPKPGWPQYDAKIQARALYVTMLKLLRLRPLIVVGHSMGGLIAVEFARCYPFAVKSLVLCSPPFYDNTKTTLRSVDERHRRIYRQLQKRKEGFLTLVPWVVKSPLTNDSFDVTEDNIDIYMSALDSSIVNQTSLTDAEKLKIPVAMIHGMMDPIVITKNLKRVAANNPNARINKIRAGHEITGRYIDAVIDEVKIALES